MFELHSLLNYSARQTVSRWGVTLIDTRLSGRKWTTRYGLVVLGRQVGLFDLENFSAFAFRAVISQRSPSGTLLKDFIIAATRAVGNITELPSASVGCRSFGASASKAIQISALFLKRCLGVFLSFPLFWLGFFYMQTRILGGDIWLVVQGGTNTQPKLSHSRMLWRDET